MSKSKKESVWDSCYFETFIKHRNRNFELHELLRQKYLESALPATKETVLQFIESELLKL